MVSFFSLKIAESSLFFLLIKIWGFYVVENVDLFVVKVAFVAQSFINARTHSSASCGLSCCRMFTLIL